jgi:hypothetical protein
MSSRVTSFSAAIAAAVVLFAGIAFGQEKKHISPANSGPASATNTMDEIYRDESHCLTSPEIRGDQDAPISCFCRDAIAEARYVYFTYILSGKDRNLNGVFLHLQQHAIETCGNPNYGEPNYDVIYHATETKDWKWNGPEVVRTYPPDNVIERISPERYDGKKDGKPTGRWVPFTVQLVYRDAQGRVTRTENYSSREFEPVFPK